MIIENLFTELNEAFEKSDIKNVAGKQWNYSLTSTPICDNGLLLVGFNWGAAKGETYIKQKTIPTKTEDLGSFKRIFPFLKIYCPEMENKIIQTNYCFFRSAKEHEISLKDQALCEPIFLKLVSFINPKQAISFSASLREHLLLRSDIFTKTFSQDIPSNKGMIKAIVGELKINSKIIPIGFLPHPNYPLNGTARQQAWKIVFENLNKN